MTSKENYLRHLMRESCESIPALKFFPLPTGVIQNVKPVPESFSALMNPAFTQRISSPACERPMRGSGYDVFGVHYTDTPTASHYTQGQKPVYDDIETWRSQVRIPDVNKLDWGTFQEEVQKLDSDNKIITLTSFSGLFERTSVLTSMEECLINAISSPDDYADLCGAIADYKIALFNKISDYIHIDIFIYHDDWGDNRNTFFSPELWRHTIKPHTKRIYDAVHKKNTLICQHSCGKIESLFDDLIEMGCDIVDIQNNVNDLYMLSKLYADKIFITANDLSNLGTFNSKNSKDDNDVPLHPGFLYPPYTQTPEFLFQ